MNPRSINAIFLYLGLLSLLVCHAGALGAILVVGGTGSTGFRAILGLLDVGYKPHQIRLLTRKSHSQKSIDLKRAGFGIVEADLEDLSSLQENRVTEGCVGCYVHSTSSDTPELDTKEVTRARNLAFVIGHEKKNMIRHIVYNSAAAHENHGVGRIQQKHDVEEVFQKTVKEYNANLKGGARNQETLAFTSLRANIFMEELWKRYTRPQILDGVYPLPVRRSRKVYLVSVRDMGRLAGTIIKENNSMGSEKDDEHIRTINVAGDYISATEIAKAFSKSQGTPCRHRNPRMMTLKSYFYFPELYEQIKFLQTFSVTTDVEELKSEFKGVMTTFEEFLSETHWEDRDLTFADFSDISLLTTV